MNQEPRLSITGEAETDRGEMSLRFLLSLATGSSKEAGTSAVPATCVLGAKGRKGPSRPSLTAQNYGRNSHLEKNSMISEPEKLGLKHFTPKSQH